MFFVFTWILKCKWYFIEYLAINMNLSFFFISSQQIQREHFIISNADLISGHIKRPIQMRIMKKCFYFKNEMSSTILEKLFHQNGCLRFVTKIAFCDFGIFCVCKNVKIFLSHFSFFLVKSSEWMHIAFF